MDCEDNNVNLSVLKYQNNVILGRILSLEPEYFSWREHVKKKNKITMMFVLNSQH